MTGRDLLDKRLEWPTRQWRAGGPWRLGHGLTVVGPGWWPLVRRGFAAVAEAPGASVIGVRQKCAVLELRPYHPDGALRAALYALAAELTQASRTRCEACGAAVVALDPAQAPRRNHCARCETQVTQLAPRPGDPAGECRLWELWARLTWPRLGPEVRSEPPRDAMG